MKSPKKALLAWASMVALSACATMQAHERELAVKPEVIQSYLADKPPQVHRLYARVLVEGERNAVLNHMRAGLAAMQLGDDETAAKSFDEALQRIEAVYAEDETSKQARSLWYKENLKDFRGESHERAMAYYYRGLIYLKAGDYENARASFKGGMLQDTFAEDQRYNADFASLAFLEGWASHCIGSSLAKESFAEAAKLKPGLPQPAATDNLLLIGETGRGPSKVAAGQRRERLEYRRDSSPEQGVIFHIGTEQVAAWPAEDIHWQATTRGGRQIDAILAGQAEFKDTTDTAGQTAVAAGSGVLAAGYAMGDTDMQAAGAIMAVVGLMAQVAAEAMRPEADVRYWDNLPNGLHIATLTAPAGNAPVTAEFVEEGKRTQRTAPVTISTSGNCSLGWVRTHSALDVTDSAPGAVAPGGTPLVWRN